MLTSPLLTSVHGLSALTAVGFDIELHDLAALPSLEGLERLTAIASDLEIHKSASLIPPWAAPPQRPRGGHVLS